MTPIRGEAAFCFLNLAALVSIVLYAQHHLHFEDHHVKQTAKHGITE